MDFLKTMQMFKYFFETKDIVPTQLEDSEDIRFNNKRQKPKIMLKKPRIVKSNILEEPGLNSSEDEDYKCDSFTVNFSRRNTIPESRRSFER